jgi:Putative polyhydroxyalkanoic acid system protein (PHA_gran_rgn)
MRITISHNRSKADVIASVDRSFNEMFSDVAGLPVKVVVEQKSWQGSTLNFALSAKWGLISTPVKGTVEVTDHDLTIDADLGMLERLVPEKTVHEMITTKAKGLLKG